MVKGQSGEFTIYYSEILLQFLQLTQNAKRLHCKERETQSVCAVNGIERKAPEATAEWSRYENERR